MAEVYADAPSIVNRLTVNVTWKRQKQAMFRIQIALIVIRFAVWVGGFGGINVSEDNS